MTQSSTEGEVKNLRFLRSSAAYSFFRTWIELGMMTFVPTRVKVGTSMSMLVYDALANGQ